MAGLRISGLASGMDIDSIVSDMMKIKRMPLDKLKQDKQTKEWQRDDYRAMNTLLFDFRSQLTEMKLSGKYNARTSTSTNEAKVSATAANNASMASYSIKKVTNLASAASKVSSLNLSKDNTKIDTKKALSDESNFRDGITWASGSVESQAKVATNDKTYQIDLKGATSIDPASVNVKVNGKLYTVETDATSFNNNTLTDVVLVDSAGKLTFKDGGIKSGNTISIDYVADKKVDTFTNIASNTNTLTLSKGSIKTIDIDGNTYTIESGKIMDAGNAIGTLENNVIKMDQSDFFKAGSNVVVTYQQNYATFGIETYNAEGKAVKENIHVQGSDSLDAVINKVNSSDVGVSMFYDSFSDKMTLTRKDTGDFKESSQEIITSGDFINQILKFQKVNPDGTFQVDESNNPILVTEDGGENAKFTINGLETQRNSNTFNINGVTITLKQTFTDLKPDPVHPTLEHSAPVTVTVNKNSDEIFNNIKGFIDKYNELIDKIQKEISEERYKDYAPLSDEQREQLSEKQQEQWEEKAKSGMLRRDSTLTSLLASMRRDFYGSVDSEAISPVYKQLTSIGISTKPYSRDGKLEINEAELKKAIEADPESVEKLFNAAGSTYEQKGIAQRLYDTVNNTMDKITAKAGSVFTTDNNQFAIGKQIKSLDNQIDRIEERLAAFESRYYRQFTAMEKAIQQANSQSAQLMQYFQ